MYTRGLEGDLITFSLWCLESVCASGSPSEIASFSGLCWDRPMLVFWTLWGSGRYFPCWNLKQAERWVISWRVENFAFGRKYIHEYFGTLWFLRKGKCLRNTKTPFRPTSTAKGTAAQDLSFVLTCIEIFYWITSIFRMLYKCTKNFL